ncbi:FixH family protein [Sphingopyxis panaciterrae]
MTEHSKRKPFTGWHMTAILVAFFSVVMTVNFTMAGLASSSFGGTVVDNSYVASQNYNEWLKRAADQERLGWQEQVDLDAARHIRVAVRKDGQLLAALTVQATLSHPLGRTPPRVMVFEPAGEGMLRSTEAVPAGRWWLDLAVRHTGERARYRVNLQ